MVGDLPSAPTTTSTIVSPSTPPPAFSTTQPPPPLSPSSSSTPGRRNILNPPIPTSSSSLTTTPQQGQKHRRVISAVEGSAAQQFLLAGFDDDVDDITMAKKPHHQDDNHNNNPTFSQWNNAALSKAGWDNGDADGLLLPPDGSVAVAAGSSRSLLSNSSDMDDESQEMLHGNGDKEKKVRVSHQKRSQQHPQQRASMGGVVVLGREEVRNYVGEWKKEFDRGLMEMREQQRKDNEKIMSFLQAESAKRSAIESRLHAQLLLQSESMVAMELKLLRLEAKVHQKEARKFQRLGVITNTIEEDLPLDDILRQERPPRVAPERAVMSSGASLVSAVTATSGLEDGISFKEEDEETLENEEDGEEGEEGTVEETVEETEGTVEEDQNDGSSEAPTQSSSVRPTTLDSILLNPTFSSTVTPSITNESTRATRPPPDPTDASSLETSVTSATLTATTASVANARISQTETDAPDASAGEQEENNIDELFGLSPPPPRSRSQSPLTVPSVGAQSAEPNTAQSFEPSTAQSFGTNTAQSIGVTSVGTSVLSTAAVAHSRDFRSRRVAAHAAVASSFSGENRPLTNRVVSFVSPDEIFQASSEAGDSVTIPDELDNLSDVVDVFVSGATRWREEYEARLDAIQKRWANE